jgi:pimeloyl-ACP methyl ester carboxylesterase
VAGAPAGLGLESKTFQAGNVLTHYVEGPPNGPPLALLHGLTRDWRSFSVLFPELIARCHVFSLDLRGHGESGRVKDGYRISAMGEDVREFLQAVIGEPAALFGHSLGAMVAMFAATDNPSVFALIVGDSLITPSNLTAMYDPIFSQLYRLLLRGGSEQELARGIGKIEIHFPGITEGLRLEELPGNSDPVLNEWARTAIRTDPDCLRMTLDRSSHDGWYPEHILPRIACPVLLLQGNPELDALLSDSDLALAKRLLPRAQHVKFPLLGHALFMQQPKPVLNEVLRFLASLE